MSKKILFRCDAGYKNQLGSGHLIRSISLAKKLIKNFRINKNDILFLVKTNNKYSLAKKILKFEKLNFKSINSNIRNYSNQEFNEINKYKFKLIIFDRLGAINLRFIKKIKKYKKKIICFDDSSINRFQCDLSCNPLVFNKLYKKKYHFSGNKYNILPSSLYKKRTRYISKIKKIFISFGGFDKKNYYKLFHNAILKNKKFKLINSNFVNKFKFEDTLNFYKKINASDLVICSGGLTMFDAINLNKIIIVIDQYKHQLKNVARLKKKGLVQYLSKKDCKRLYSIIINLNKSNKIKNLQNKINEYNRSQKSNVIINKIYDIYAK